VLVADDNPVNRLLAVRLLEKRGYLVRSVENGAAALATVEKERFDLAFVDIQMPQMDGFEATRAIRAREERTTGHLPIVAMTAHAMKGDREKCLAAGMDDYVSKPFGGQILYEVIGRLCDRKASS
jgi:CheY-like chemotaxis protein